MAEPITIDPEILASALFVVVAVPNGPGAEVITYGAGLDKMATAEVLRRLVTHLEIAAKTEPRTNGEMN